MIFRFLSRLTFFCTGFLLFLAVPVFAASSTGLDSKIRIEENRMRTIEKQVQYHKKALSRTRQKEKSLLKELSGYDTRRKLTEQKIRVLELQSRKVRNNINDLEDELGQLQKRIDIIKSCLAERFVAIYKYGGVAEMNLLLSARGTADVLSTSYLLRKIARRDEEMIHDLEEKSRAVERDSRELEVQKDLLEKRKGKLISAREEYRIALKKRDGLLRKLKRDEAVHARAARELVQSQRAVQHKIEEYMRQKKKSSRDGRAPKKYVASGSKLSWPVSGRVLSPFGQRIHPVFKTKIMHTGIDLRARQGTPVKAAAGGGVLYAGWLRGYGQIVIIDHGSNMTTVYAHLSQILVSEGRSVKRGAVLGRVGATGVATGPHLHFEVRINGDARNPLKYLRRR